jgi:hypothetical protein
MAARRLNEPIEPMTLGNMRANDVRSLDVCCWVCHHRTILSADPWSDDVPVPSFGPRMVWDALQRLRDTLSRFRRSRANARRTCTGCHSPRPLAVGTLRALGAAMVPHEHSQASSRDPYQPSRPTAARASRRASDLLS